ncbi:unnamed protein product [Debaryomyces tyrocola]|nr:unnamed protein product [Debaryomyces tyrocola]
MYNYSDLIIEGFPQKDSYYNVYLNELEINVLIKKSQFAASFPSFLCQDIGINAKPPNTYI